MELNPMLFDYLLGLPVDSDEIASSEGVDLASLLLANETDEAIIEEYSGINTREAKFRVSSAQERIARRLEFIEENR